MTDSNSVLFDVDQYGVATITLNSPEKHNAFDDTIIAKISQLCSEIADNSDIKIVVLASTGKSFCAGADLNWMKKMASYSHEQNMVDANALAQMFRALNFLPQPTIAKIQGAAFGGGVGLASCCDMVWASEKASFCLSEVKLGLIPATISPYVINAIGQKACRRYFLTAERFSAEKAMTLGLVNEVVPLEKLDESVNDLVNMLLNNGPQALKLAKQLALDIAYQDINDELITITSERIASVRVSPEGQEGLSSFFEKRSANWQLASTNKG